MLTRRDLLRSLLAAPLVLTSHGLRSVSAQERIRLLDLRAQRKFVNRLERPARALPAPGTRHYEIAVRQFRRSVGLIDPRTRGALETTLWGYDGQYPGPTFEVRRGEPVSVRWINALAADGRPLPHLLPVDRSIHLAHTIEACQAVCPS
jgi:spore coat protein A